VNWMAALLIVWLVSGCFGWDIDYSVEGRHEAFKTMYGRQVGSNADDPERSWLARYPQNILGRQELSNGNIEIEFRTNSGPKCRVFYEVDAETHIVVSWRFEGNAQDCRWIGP
jgi:hypothetical protein